MSDESPTVSMGITMTIPEWEALFVLLSDSGNDAGRQFATLIYEGLRTALTKTPDVGMIQ